MKLFLTLVSIIVCLNLTLLKAYPQPENSPADLGGLVINAVPTSVTAEDIPPEVLSPEFPHLALKCISEDDWKTIESCEKETELKLNMTKPTIKSGASKEEIDKFLEEDKKFGPFACECLVKIMGVADEMTSQLDMAGYGKFYETTSLSSEQKTLASADFISCMTANLITPSLPVFVRWTESRNEVIGNLITASHVIACDLHSLIKNGCSDTSVSNSTLAWFLQDLQTRIAKEIIH
ncbi:hypothetical protein DAPPUDRAFT_300234 [Daphnia pulex]|uniref:Uncharacterized protein n=1 Tax=Daphnia pulex TaxID=6669 RepID=E9G5I9_DAPPU|nr:hypothetical protein DAPPUDRAFT_300234 [Daphnia pulex]|eukprot:EFX85625.1 hypothetical protein DAPPUDRAFT_300234 [Daphnia pulex]